MNSKIKIFLLVLCFIILFFVNCKQQEEKTTITKALDPISQSNRERIWVTIRIDTILDLQISPPIMYEPMKCKIDIYGNIYVLDGQLGSVIKFSSKGKFISIFGKGHGSGPGETLNPTDFFIDKQGKVYIADNFSISIFNSNSVFERRIKLQQVAYIDKFLVLGEYKYLVRDINFNSFFKVFNDSGKIVNSFGKELILSNQETILPYDVFLCSNNNSIYGVFVRAGYIFGYSLEGENIFYRETIDKVPFPKLNVKSNENKSVISIDPFSPIVNWDISFSRYKDNIIYINPGDFSKRQNAIVFDAYSAIDGKYIYSFKINRPNNVFGVSSCIINDNYIYLTAFGEKNSLIYKFRFSLI